MYSLMLSVRKGLQSYIGFVGVCSLVSSGKQLPEML